MIVSEFLQRSELKRKEGSRLDPSTIIEAVYKCSNALRGKSQLKSTAGYLRLVARNVEQAVHARENGNFYALHSMRFPIEFFWPLGITPLSSEIYSTIVGMMSHDNQQLLSIANGIDSHCYSCPNCRAFFDMADVGEWPLPDFTVQYSSPCDPMQDGRKMVGTYMDIPGFCLEHPARIFTPQSMDHDEKGHRALLRFLEEQTGRTMDYGLLKEATRLSYRATQVCKEINELRKAVPCPLPAEAAFAPMAVYRAWAGTQTCVDFLEQLRDELRERVAKGIGAVQQEAFRYTYATSLPCFNFGITAEIEKRYGAVNVTDHLQWWREDGDWLIDPDDPVASLACRAKFARYNSLHGTADDWAAEVCQDALKSRADCIIHVNNRCCPHVAEDSRILKDSIERSLGLSWTTIDCDIPDKSSTTFKEVLERLDVFFATVERSKPYQERTRQRRQQGKTGGLPHERRG